MSPMDLIRAALKKYDQWRYRGMVVIDANGRDVHITNNTFRHGVTLTGTGSFNITRNFIAGGLAMRGVNYATAVAAPQPDRAPLPRRVATEAFVGFRAWRLCRDSRGIGLMSTARPFVWDGPVLRDEQPPAEREVGKHTGIHAYNDVKAAMAHRAVGTASSGNTFGSSMLGTYSAISLALHGAVTGSETTEGPEHLSGKVWGEVMLFGTVVVHELGYRAQSAMIRSLYVPPETFMKHDDIVQTLAARYGCDVHTDIVKWRAAWQ